MRELRRVLSADMQFQGRSHILSVGVDNENIGVEGLRKAFAAAYWRRFGIELPEIPPVLVNLHTAVIGVRPEISLATLVAAERAPTLKTAKVGARRVWFTDGWYQTPRLRPEKLPLDAAVRRAGDPGATRLHDRRRAGRQGHPGQARNLLINI